MRDLLLVVNCQDSNELLVLQLHVGPLNLASWYLNIFVVAPDLVLPGQRIRETENHQSLSIKPEGRFDMPRLYCPGILDVHAHVKDSLAEGVVELLCGERAKHLLSLRNKNVFIFLAILLRVIDSKFRQEQMSVGSTEFHIDNLSLLPKIIHIPQ